MCQPQKAADCDVSSLDGMTAQASSGRAINVIKGVPLVGDLPFTDRSYTFTTMGSFGGDLRGGTSATATAASWNTGNARPMYYVQPANDDKNIASNTVMWTLNVPVPVTIYLDFWGGDAHVNTLGLKDWLLSPTTQWVRQLDESGTAFTPNYGPGPVFSQTFPAGTIEIMGVSAAAPFASSAEAQRKRLHRTAATATARSISSSSPTAAPSATATARAAAPPPTRPASFMTAQGTTSTPRSTRARACSRSPPSSRQVRFNPILIRS